jgi:hypothetical protein
MDGAGGACPMGDVFAKQMRVAVRDISRLRPVAMDEAKLLGKAKLLDVVRDN